MSSNTEANGRIAARSLIQQIVINEEEIFQTAMEADSSGKINILKIIILKQNKNNFLKK